MERAHSSHGKGPAGKRLRAEVDVTLTSKERADHKPPPPALGVGGGKPCKALEKQQGHGNQPKHETGMEGVSQRLDGCVLA